MIVDSKLSRILSGVCFLVLSAGASFLSYKLINVDVAEVNLTRIKNAQLSSCAASFKGDKTHLNFTTEVVGSKLYFMSYGLDGWEGGLTMASTITANCGGMSLTSLCFGEECNINELTGDSTKPVSFEGLFFSLEFDESNIDPRVNVSFEE